MVNLREIHKLLGEKIVLYFDISKKLATHGGKSRKIFKESSPENYQSYLQRFKNSMHVLSAEILLKFHKEC